MRIGYRRFSTVDQNTSGQLEGVLVDRMFTDHQSDRIPGRPQLAGAIEFARDGDTLVVASMDRVARDIEDLRQTVRELTNRGVNVEFVREKLTFTAEDSPIRTALRSMLDALADFERSKLVERRREGIASAKAAGKYKGRKAVLTDEQANQIRVRLAENESVTALAREFGVSRQTIYNYASKETNP